MSLRPKSTLVLVAATAIVLAGATGTATAADSYASPTLKAVVSIDTAVISPTSRRIVGRVTVTAGARTVAVEIETGSPSFKRMQAGKRVSEGPTLRPVRFRTIGREPRMFSDGSTSATYGGGPGGPLCQRESVGPQSPHGGFSYGGLSRGYLLKPRESVTLEADIDIASDPPWFGSDYRPIFRVRPAIRSIGDGTKLFKRGTLTLKRPVTLRPPAPFVTGPFAALIDIKQTGDVYSPEPGVLKGAILPAEAGRTINFSASRLSLTSRAVPDPKPIGSAITAADGSFTFSTAVLPKKAFYLVVPSYPEQPGSLLADTPCPFIHLGRKILTVPPSARVTP